MGFLSRLLKGRALENCGVAIENSCPHTEEYTFWPCEGKEIKVEFEWGCIHSCLESPSWRATCREGGYQRVWRGLMDNKEDLDCVVRVVQKMLGEALKES